MVIFAPTVQIVEKCDEEDFICEDQKMCIPFDKTCNGISDCADASDESSEYCSEFCSFVFKAALNRGTLSVGRGCSSSNEVIG